MPMRDAARRILREHDDCSLNACDRTENHLRFDRPTSDPAGREGLDRLLDDLAARLAAVTVEALLGAGAIEQQTLPWLARRGAARGATRTDHAYPWLSRRGGQ